MHRSIAGHYTYNLFISTIDYSTDFTTIQLLTIEHMVMFVVISIVVQINGQVYGSINCSIISYSILKHTKINHTFMIKQITLYYFNFGIII